jgi:hypothetical protein
MPSFPINVFIGKTHVALGIAYAVASGGEFLGWKARERDQRSSIIFLSVF